MQVNHATDYGFSADEIYSVSDFLALTKSTIENNIPTCWLKGEISNFSRPASGHWYFSLKDERGQVRCAMFRMNQRAMKFVPENGMEVLIQAIPTLYEQRGDFQLIARQIEPMGAGNLQAAFEQLKAKLQKEGLFDIQHKKPLPKEIKAIGVISSSNGAVIRDIIKVLNKRYPFAEVLLFDCVVQGEGSAEKLSQAIYAADKSNHCDILILARGGGSLEDLWAFNEEVLARAVFASNTPIISAIGHETDTTISDFVADMRAPTPSAAAMMATPDRLELLAKLDKLHSHLLRCTQKNLNDCQQHLEKLGLNTVGFGRQLNMFSQRLDELNKRLNSHFKATFTLKQSQLNTLSEQLKQYSPMVSIRHKKELNQRAKAQLNNTMQRQIAQQRLNVTALNQQLKKSMDSLIEQQKYQLGKHSVGLNHLSPLKILTRGYSISMSGDNQLLQSTTKVKIGDTIITKLTDGKLYSKVDKIEQD
ncbi:exodeoxyribonuclease VII large subunit [Bathymodiolus septemdierum thioautotrophic gill symbiont]|uniref:Exodeoxyribonuclease 7 large subunit n=1 Tax=endosymbiont of Bathymodiolus septemdierum str. Myojin knoll TaxID=1303921 RepID=A0A0P0USM9_9GAMM|nr:exodeoxyribonuclease VII large subunit [endosymbiont of Bathymodiolus septemdierum str. Myojin knoll]